MRLRDDLGDVRLFLLSVFIDLEQPLGNFAGYQVIFVLHFELCDSFFVLLDRLHFFNDL